jgi:succinate-semialdehyde dehydrogenase/glutarate-semialdehyde dehydrogenase
VEKLRIGDGLQDGVTTGPLIDEKAVAKVEEHIADAIAKGAKVVTGGKPHALGGNFFQPTILVNVPDSAKVAKEETFGPLAPLFRFKMKPTSLPRPTIPSSASPPISTPAI